MKKILVIGGLLFAMVAGAAEPIPEGWVEVTKGEDGTRFAAHAKTLKKVGEAVEVWILMDMPQPGVSGERSWKALVVASCAKREVGYKATTRFKGAWGTGAIVNSRTNTYVAMEPVAPDSVAEGILEAACGK